MTLLLNIVRILATIAVGLWLITRPYHPMEQEKERGYPDRSHPWYWP